MNIFNHPGERTEAVKARVLSLKPNFLSLIPKLYTV